MQQSGRIEHRHELGALCHYLQRGYCGEIRRRGRQWTGCRGGVTPCKRRSWPSARSLKVCRCPTRNTQNHPDAFKTGYAVGALLGRTAARAVPAWERAMRSIFPRCNETKNDGGSPVHGRGAADTGFISKFTGYFHGFPFFAAGRWSGVRCWRREIAGNISRIADYLFVSHEIGLCSAQARGK